MIWLGGFACGVLLAIGVMLLTHGWLWTGQKRRGGTSSDPAS